MSRIKQIAQNQYIGVSFLWFGAAISIAEITTGTFAAPLGLQQGFLAVFLGHVIGCALFFAMGLIGAKLQQPSMKSLRAGFGRIGSKMFAVLNLTQLVGWTAVMLYSGGILFDKEKGLAFWGAAAAIAVGIIIWVIVTNRFSHLLNSVMVALLALVCVGLTVSILMNGSYSEVPNTDDITFSAALEMSVAMPLSWLPMVADYTYRAKKPIKIALAATVSYFISGCWMYFIGLSAALFIGASDPDTALNTIFRALPLFGVPVLIGIFSSIVNTFIDANSAGECFLSLINEDGAKNNDGESAQKSDGENSERNANRQLESTRKTITKAAVVATILAFLIFAAVSGSDSFMDSYQAFLGVISAVFAPLITVQIVSFFVFRQNCTTRATSIPNLGCWLVGFLLYEVLLNLEFSTPVGLTVPVVAATAVLALLVNSLVGKKGSEVD